MKLLLFCLFFTIYFSNNCYSQSITIDNNSFGFIVIDDSVYNGTGFVLLNKRTVVTCAHVVDSTKKISFVAFKTDNPFILHLIKYDLDNDIAVLESQTDICKHPLLPDTTFNIVPQQHLFYLGYNILESNSFIKSLQVNNAFVNAVGKASSGKAVVDFIEFNGVGIPGYSGGPVFNDNGKVIAIMREAWLKQGIKGGQVELINRAFSVRPIFK